MYTCQDFIHDSVSFANYIINHLSALESPWLELDPHVDQKEFFCILIEEFEICAMHTG